MIVSTWAPGACPDGVVRCYAQILWTFSIYLEAVAILPQLVLLQRTQNIDNLTGNYVFLLGCAQSLLLPGRPYWRSVSLHMGPGPQTCSGGFCNTALLACEHGPGVVRSW